MSATGARCRLSARATAPGTRVLYQKHMSHHLLPVMGREWLDGLTHVSAIATARDAASLDERLEAFALPDTGLPQQVEIFDRCAPVRHVPPVIDRGTCSRHPAGARRAVRAPGRAIHAAHVPVAGGPARHRWHLGQALVRSGRALHLLRALSRENRRAAAASGISRARVPPVLRAALRASPHGVKGTRASELRSAQPRHSRQHQRQARASGRRGASARSTSSLQAAMHVSGTDCASTMAASSGSKRIVESAHGFGQGAGIRGDSVARRTSR